MMAEDAIGEGASRIGMDRNGGGMGRDGWGGDGSALVLVDFCDMWQILKPGTGDV